LLELIKKSSEILQRMVPLGPVDSTISSLIHPKQQTNPKLMPQKQEGGTSQWNYNRNGADWPGVCESGEKQSPIAILTTASTPLPAQSGVKLCFGTAQGLKVINTGHSIQVEWDKLRKNNVRIPTRGMWNSSQDATVSLEPFQFHVHSTCEHAVDGNLCPLELHLVTRVDQKAKDSPAQCKTANCLAVFGVIYTFDAEKLSKAMDQAQNTTTIDRSNENILDLMVNQLPKGAGKANAVSLPSVSLDLATLLPEDHTLAWYQGSLTTPPCSEEVSWHVFTQPKKQLSSWNLNALQSVMALTEVETECSVDNNDEKCVVPSGARTNNRALQPLFGRDVFVGSF
jgi:carbonic anhydrase